MDFCTYSVCYLFEMQKIFNLNLRVLFSCLFIEMPLDLSSATENTKDKPPVPEKLPEDANDVSKINTGIIFFKINY